MGKCIKCMVQNIFSNLKTNYFYDHNKTCGNHIKQILKFKYITTIILKGINMILTNEKYKILTNEEIS